MVLTHKGSPKCRYTKIEKNTWNKKVSVKFQKSAWVDTGIANKLATYFVEYKKA